MGTGFPSLPGFIPRCTYPFQHGACFSIFSSGRYKRHDGFNPVQIKDGKIVRLRKDGTIKTILGEQGKYGKEKKS